MGDGDGGGVFGCLIRAVPTKRGTLTWKDIEPVIYGRGNFRAATGCIEIENTANLTGGRVHTALAVMEEIWEKAKERKLPGASGWGAHLQCVDGARRGCEDADEWVRHRDVLPVERPVRAGGIHAGGLGEK